MIEIVQFAPQHAHSVIKLILPIQQDEFHIPITLDQQPDLQDIPSFYQQGVGNFWVGLDDHEVVGTVALIDLGNKQVALRKMFVAASHRGTEHQVAKQLLDHLFTWCQTRSVREIYLGTTAKFLAAHRFYEKNGFFEISRAELPDAFPVMVVDTKFYKFWCV
jgi:N-acetylglutamate synthase-like GNAT family acetyltransferase